MKTTLTFEHANRHLASRQWFNEHLCKSDSEHILLPDPVDQCAHAQWCTWSKNYS